MTGSIASLPSWYVRKSCGICVNESPQWFWIAESLGFRISWVWGRSEDVVPRWLKQLSPETHFTTISLHLSAVDVVFGDWSWKSAVPEWLISDSASYGILCNFGLHSLDCSQSSSKCVGLRHEALGGVTESDCRVNLTNRVASPPWRRTTLPYFLPTSVASIAGDTLEAGKRAFAPKHALLSPVVVTPMGRADVFHGGGLHPGRPSDETPVPKFLLRSVCHRPSGCIRGPLILTLYYLNLALTWPDF